MIVTSRLSTFKGKGRTKGVGKSPRHFFRGHAIHATDLLKPKEFMKLTKSFEIRGGQKAFEVAVTQA
ncbi:hypothetical protein R1flu_002997 [Riccia fluitans]|uniref:Uncharacterized protein n=1 Tax=Riccia fluitans TaxID=41844 RepID=A0ABD1YAR4_9MARC